MQTVKHNHTGHKIMIIGFTGRAGAGKDTCANFFVTHYMFRKLSWAGPLKAGLAAMGFPEPANREDKEKQIPGFEFSWRQAAQALGTEWGRSLDPDIWVKVAERIMASAPKGTAFVISDVRFENEAAMIRRAGGMVVHILGRAADLGAAAAHVSEELPCILNEDWVIQNNGDMEQLEGQLEYLARSLA